MSFATRFLCVGAVLSLTTAVSRANTWYVDASATPPGNGTQGSPYTSIQYAHDQPTTLDSDLLLVAPGTYVENLVLSKRITVRATGGPDATTLRPAAAGAILTLNGPSDELDSLVFEGFWITGVTGPSGTEAVRSFDGKLLSCVVAGNRGNNYYGFTTQYDGNAVDCTIADNDHGVAQYNIGYTRLRNTVLWNRGGDFHLNTGFVPDVEYCAMGKSGWSGTGTFMGDPLLCYAWNGELHPRAGSPCIDAGDPSLPNDPDGSPGDIGYYAFDPQHACGPFTDFCPGDGTAAACPCGNSGALARGCQNSATTGGALFWASGTTSPDTVVLHASFELPNALSIFLQGNATSAPGVTFGDGLRCASGILKRLYVKGASGGAVSAPAGGDPSVTARSAALGDPIPPGERRYYQTYYRDPNSGYCTTNTFNSSSGAKVVW